MAYIDHETEQNIRKLMVAWYGPQAQGWGITDKTVIAVGKVLEASGQCSAVFKYVPQGANPFTAGAGITGSAIGYIKDAIKRASSDTQIYYNSCVVMEANRYKEEVYMSGM